MLNIEAYTTGMFGELGNTVCALFLDETTGRDLRPLNHKADDSSWKIVMIQKILGSLMRPRSFNPESLRKN